MTIFAPALTNALKIIANESGGIGNIRRNSAVETRIHNFLNTHHLADQIPTIEAWFADLHADEVEAIAYADVTAVAIMNTAPAFAATVLDNFAEMVAHA